MQKIAQLALMATAITLASCGAKSDNNATSEKQAKLAELKKQQAGITAQIETLEKNSPKPIPPQPKKKRPNW